MQLKPHPLLSTIVKHHLLIESEQSAHLKYRLFSDGNPGIVFHLKDPLLQFNEDYSIAQIQPQSFVYGQITRYNNIALNGKLQMLVVVLQPHALLTLFNIAAFELNNCTVKLIDLLGQDAVDLEDQLSAALTPHQIAAVIERFLLKKLSSLNESDPNIKRAVNIIYQRNGMITVEDLLKALPITERQLERKFKELIGITPKKFADTIKFQNFVKCLQKNPVKKSINEVIFDCGYYDQAHLNNYFRKSTGITPLQYKANNNLLALNFMQVG